MGTLCRPTSVRSVAGITATGARSSLWGSPASTPFPAGTPHSCCWHWGRDPRSAGPLPPPLAWWGPGRAGAQIPPLSRGASSLGLADNGPVFPGLTGLSSEKRLKGVFSVPLKNLCCRSVTRSLFLGCSGRLCSQPGSHLEITCPPWLGFAFSRGWHLCSLPSAPSQPVGPNIHCRPNNSSWGRGEAWPSGRRNNRLLVCGH